MKKLQEKLIGLGEHSARKSYYPELQKQMDDLARFKTLLDHTHDYIFLAKAASGIIVDMNGSAARRLAYQRKFNADNTETIYDFFTESLLVPVQEKMLASELPEEAHLTIDAYLRTPDKQELPVEINFRLVYFAGEKYIVAVARDITERKKAAEAMRQANDLLEMKVSLRTQELLAMNQELQAMNMELEHTLSELQRTQNYLVQSEKMVALGSLVAGVAHEINTPVGMGVTIASHLEQITKELTKRYENNVMSRADFNEYLAECREVAQILLDNLERAAQLITNFKQVSVDQTSEVRRVFNLKEYLGGILFSLSLKLKKTKHRVTVVCDDKLEIDSFPGALSQMVTNLLLNSLLHAYEPAQAGNITITAEKIDGEQLLLIYKDDGKGMSQEVLARAFDPFFTTKRGSGGSGLGLYIVYNIVTQRFKGTVDCVSNIDQGTEFRIAFPLVLSEQNYGSFAVKD